MSDEKSALRNVLGLYSLTHRHLDYCLESFQALRPAYHNEEHCYSTALTFHTLAEQAGLDLEETRNGLVAALYHDAQHLMASEDKLNIKNAVQWVRRADFFEDSIDLSRVCKLIKATNNANERFRSRAEILIHDADLLQTVKGTVVENFKWQGRLATEMATRVTAEESLNFVLARLRSPESIEFLKKRIVPAQRGGKL